MRLVALASLLATAAAQSCSFSSCSSCVATSGCVWSNCGCTSSPSYCNGATSTCPVPPTPASFAWPFASPLATLAIGVSVIIALAVFVFSPLRDGARTAQPSLPQRKDIALLFCASASLWLGISLVLAAPVVPWLVYASPSGRFGSTYITAFSYSFCQTVSASSSSYICQSVSSISYLNNYILNSDNTPANTADQTTISNYVNSGVAAGAFYYIAAFACLLPAAAMTALAAYRVTRLATTGVPPYFGGVSATSLQVAQICGWVGFAVTSIVWWAALGLCNNISTLYSKVITGDPDTLLSYVSMPGPVLCGLAFAFLLTGCVLTTLAANALRDITGVGCTYAFCHPAHEPHPSQRHWLTQEQQQMEAQGGGAPLGYQQQQQSPPQYGYQQQQQPPPQYQQPQPPSVYRGGLVASEGSSLKSTLLAPESVAPPRFMVPRNV